MNVEIAQRLAELRREKGYSQEELAENLGLSRQAVSKWERAESSPDTGNLIALAKLYGVTLDELLRIDADIEDDIKFEAEDRQSQAEEKALEAARKAEEAAAKAVAAAVQSTAAAVQSTEVAASTFASSAPTPSAGSVPPPATAAQAEPQPAAPQATAAQAAPQAAPYVEPQPATPYTAAQQPYAGPSDSPSSTDSTWSFWRKFPYPILCVIVFLLGGFLFHAWHPAWIVFLTIPLFYWAVDPKRTGASQGEKASPQSPETGYADDSQGSYTDGAQASYYDGATPQDTRKSRNPWMTFPYPVLCVIVFLLIGAFTGFWHPAWVIFLTVPLYYWIAHIIINDPNYRR